MFYGTETWTLQKINHNFLASSENVVLEKSGEDQCDRTCEKRRTFAWNKGGKKRYTKYRNKEGFFFGLSRLAQELCSKTRYWRKDSIKNTRDGKMKKKK